MGPFYLICSIFVFLLTDNANAWYLDSSCHNPLRTAASCDGSTHLPSMADLVTYTMKSAIQMAHISNRTLHNLKDGKGNQHQVDLMSHMFQFAVKGNRVESSDYLDRVISVYEQIIAFDREGNGNPSKMPTGALPTDDVVLFCDYTRYNEYHDCNGNPWPDRACDTVADAPMAMNDLYYNCADPNPFSNPYGSTMNTEGATVSTIQLCQWWLEQYYYAGYQSVPNIAHNNLLAAAGVIMSPAQNPAMDIGSGLDDKLLHELTHAVPKMSTWDVADMNSYGWHNCRGISDYSRDPDNMQDQTWSSFRNAENYAKFGLGAALISPFTPNVQPQHVNRDGSIAVIPQGQIHRRRELHEELEAHLMNGTAASPTTQPESAFNPIVARSKTPKATSTGKRQAVYDFIGKGDSEESFDKQQSILSRLATMTSAPRATWTP